MARAGRKDRGLFTRPDSSGKRLWYVRLSHAGRERRFGSFPNKTAAREFYEKAKKEQKDGHFFPERYQKGGSTLQAVVDQHLATFTGRSFRDEKRFRREWLKLFPCVKLNAVTPAALEQARARLLEGRAIGTVNRYMQFMRRCLNKAVRDQQIGSNPMSQVKCFGSQQERRGFCPRRKKQRCVKKLDQRIPYGFGCRSSAVCVKANNLLFDGKMSTWNAGC